MRHTRQVLAVPMLVFAMAVARNTAAQVAGEANHGYVRYTNVRFGFSFAYPADVFSAPEPPPVNNDGAVFKTPDGRALVGGAASFNALFETIDSLWKEAMEEAGEKNVTYRRRAASWFVISGTDPTGRVFYRRTELRKDIIFSLWFEYREADKKRFDPIVESMVKLYRVTADGDDVEQ